MEGRRASSYGEEVWLGLPLTGVSRIALAWKSLSSGSDCADRYGSAVLSSGGEWWAPVTAPAGGWWCAYGLEDIFWFRVRLKSGLRARFAHVASDWFGEPSSDGGERGPDEGKSLRGCRLLCARLGEVVYRFPGIGERIRGEGDGDSRVLFLGGGRITNGERT